MRLGFLSILTLITAVSGAAAHEGPRIWLDIAGGRVTTLTSDNDFEPTLYTPSRVFATEFGTFFGVWTTDFPGFEVVQFDGGVAGNTTFGFNLAGPALFFDAELHDFVTVREAFGPPQTGPVPELAVSLGAAIRTTTVGPVPGFDFFTFHQIGDHSHLAFTLLGDGASAVDGPTGVYVLQFEVTSQGTASSEPVYLLLGKGLSTDDPVFVEAIEIATAMLVAEAAPGDANCDGSFTLEDVSDMAIALVDPALYSNTHGCDILRCDMNHDGTVDGFDLQSFCDALLP